MSRTIDYFHSKIVYSINMDDEVNKIIQSLNFPEIKESSATFILDHFEAGAKVHERLLLNDYEVRLTKTNKEYLTLTFSNQNGMYRAKMWDNQGAIKQTLPLLEKHRVFDVSAVVDEYNQNKSLTINHLDPVQQAIEPFTLLPFPKLDLKEIAEELIFYLTTLNEPYKTLALETLRHFWDDFLLAPAAKGFHHNYIGGLIKHTTGLMRFTYFIQHHDKGPVEALLYLIAVVEKVYKHEVYAEAKKEKTERKRPVWQDTLDHLYKMLNQFVSLDQEAINFDVLYTSILYHDLGKLLEYDYAGKSYQAFDFLYPHADKQELDSRAQGGIEMDALGVMVGHIPYGAMLLQQMLNQLKTPLSLSHIHEINHCILCHHGLPEWGSAVRAPQTAEGYLIHLVDYFDSRYENEEMAYYRQ